MKAMHQHPESAPLLRCRFLIGQGRAGGTSWCQEAPILCQLLHRVDPNLNMARFYRVEVLPDLFGAIIVERRWGRIGGRGQCRAASY